MALLKKKVDPLTDRAKALNAEIAALESKIRKLNQQTGAGGAQPEVNKSGARVRSTALPNGSTLTVTTKAPDPVFEPVDQNPIKNADSRSSATQIHDLS